MNVMDGHRRKPKDLVNIPHTVYYIIIGDMPALTEDFT